MKNSCDTLTERMAMLAFYITPCDEEAMLMLVRFVRRDDHAAIARLIIADHTMTDDTEAQAMVDSIYAGGEAG